MPPFSALRPEHFEPAFEVAMQVHREELADIAGQAEAPSFDNTLARFDRSGRLLGRLQAVFACLTASATSEPLMAVQRRVAAPLASHHSAVYRDQGLFARIDELHRRRDTLGLAPEALRLLERVHLDFVRAGARLGAAERERLGQITAELATWQTRFAQNLLRDEAAFVLPLPDEPALAGLPGHVRAALRQAAADRGLSGSVVTLARSLVVPFLTFSARADLREQVWRAWVGRGEQPGETDNREVARQILRLRRELAGLHGHRSFADHALADTMAGSQAAVSRLLDDVWTRALGAVARERDALLAQMRAEGQPAQEVQPWDWRLWAEKVRQARFEVDDAEVKPYFPLRQVVAAAFDCAQRLFGLRFTPAPDVPVYHPDVRAYTVHAADGRPVGLFLQDNFARPGKRSGAWMSVLRWQTRNVEPGQSPHLPLVLNNNNFARGAGDDPAAQAAGAEPTLLSLDDARTLFHEFGHGLHGLLSQVGFERLSGTQVLRDFVELPSQLFEHWITEPEVLQRHARHWRTGEPIPPALVEKLQQARRFGQGYDTVRYTASALVDMAVHARTEAEPPEDLCAFEADLMQRLGLPHGVGLNHRLVHFQHLFASAGYAAGYYVYLWAEVLDADGYGAFEEAGDPFAPDVAQRLLRHIYSSGNSVDPQAAFIAFRGRPPVVEPLLAKRGLLALAPAA